MPDSKDFEAVKKHITAKYKEKKYAVKHPEKEIIGVSNWYSKEEFKRLDPLLKYKSSRDLYVQQRTIVVK
jgi:hypothetical protein